MSVTPRNPQPVGGALDQETIDSIKDLITDVPDNARLVPTLPADAAQFLNGVGAFSVPVIPFQVSSSDVGQPADGVFTKYVSVARAAHFSTNFAGSVGFCGTNPTSAAVYHVYKNGSSVLTVSISTLGVFTFSGSAASYAAGDVIKILTPTPQDMTLADVSFTLLGTS